MPTKKGQPRSTKSSYYRWIVGGPTLLLRSAGTNKILDEDEINFVVQQTLDRIIFLRIAEDRGIEPYGNLKSAARQGDCYQNLYTIFGEADAKYNSGLFDFKKRQA